VRQAVVAASWLDDGNGRHRIASALKLTMELIPELCWYRNLRNTLPTGRWAKLSKAVREKAGCCEICGSTQYLQCDEQWSYDDERFVQRLERLRCVCPTCHAVMTFGLTSIIARQQPERYPTLIENVISHFMRVNGVDRNTFVRYKSEAFRQ